MNFGISIFPTDYTIGPGDLADAAEQRGFDSFWVPEHSHFPVSPLTPGHDEGGLPNMYYDVGDPFVSLGMAAQATTDILLGTSICLVVQRDPIQLAKQVATLDAFSGGRFQFGVGGGWNPLEMANHGTDYNERLAVMDERIAAMKQIWSEDKAEFHGKHVDFGPVYAWPKPAQQPHPPIHVACNLPQGIKRVVRQGDGWFPLLQDGNPDSVIEQLPTLHSALEAAGRSADSVEVSVYICPNDEDVILKLRDAGIHRVIFLLDPLAPDATLAQLDERAALIDRCS
jgi:probable F420-dependent oxidoreductase